MLGISAVSPPISGRVHVQLAAGEVVEEEQRLGALHQDVVDAHRHQILAHGVMAVQLEGQLELGAHAVRAGHQHWLLELLREFEQRAESADAGHHAFTHGALGERLDAVYQRVAGVDVNTGIAVGKACLAGVLGCAHEILLVFDEVKCGLRRPAPRRAGASPLESRF
jgi:hypothetical protein